MIQNGLLTMREEIVEGKIRKYYRITPVGNELLIKAKQRVNALISEVGGQPDASLQ
jgi:DNA-binding PadR family transcriptional regulator